MALILADAAVTGFTQAAASAAASRGTIRRMKLRWILAATLAAHAASAGAQTV